MNIFHRHQWRLVSSNYNPRPVDMTNIRGEKELVLKGAYGFTVITQECSECGLIRTETTAGRA